MTNHQISFVRLSFKIYRIEEEKLGYFRKLGIIGKNGNRKTRQLEKVLKLVKLKSSGKFEITKTGISRFIKKFSPVQRRISTDGSSKGVSRAY